jgi:hypothetical protein
MQKQSLAVLGAPVIKWLPVEVKIVRCSCGTHSVAGEGVHALVETRGSWVICSDMQSQSDLLGL